MTIPASESKGWPIPGVAGLLGLFAVPLGMLYARRPGWALAYIVIGILLASLHMIAGQFEAVRSIPSGAYDVLSWGLRLACAVHATVLASRTLAGERPQYTRWYGLSGAAVALFMVFFSVRAFVFEQLRTPSTSMHPSLPEGATFVISKLGLGNYGAYGLRLPEFPRTRRIERGDVVAFRVPNDPEIRFVSRVIGVGGDHIQYLNRQLTINGVAVATTPGDSEQDRRGISYRYATESIDGQRIEVAWIPEREPRDIDKIVPAGYFMMLSDNRDNARDSRYLGMIPHANIEGIVPKSQLVTRH